MVEHFNPYDLNDVGRLMEQHKLKRESQKAARNRMAQKRIAELKARNELNPYDLQQISEIFGPPDPKDF